MLWSDLVFCMGSGPLLVFILVAVSPLVIADLGLTPQYGAIVSVTYGSDALGAFLLGGPAGPNGCAATYGGNLH